jgi:hypothetical protein
VRLKRLEHYDEGSGCDVMLMMPNVCFLYNSVHVYIDDDTLILVSDPVRMSFCVPAR